MQAAAMLLMAATLQLPVPPRAVQSSVELAPQAQPADTVLLYGNMEQGRFVIASTELPARSGGGTPRRGPIPLGANLLGDFTLRPYGLEERVHAAVEKGRLRLRCEAGSKPAGLLLSGPWFLPEAELAWQAAFTARGRFALAVADAAQSAAEASAALGVFEGNGGGPSSARFVQPRSAGERAQWKHLAIACPAAAAELTVEALALAPEPQPARAAAQRATWIWRGAAWREQPERVLAHARAYGLRTLYITVPFEKGAVKEPKRLAAFVRRARAQGVAVWPVDGDPHMALPQQHAATQALVRAYAAYNRAAKPEERLAGLQFDVEPYLLKEYKGRPAQLERDYLAMARLLHAAADGLPLEFVVPFWWDDRTELLDRLAAHADGLVVMDYRTDPGQIRRFAAPFLDWGVRHGRRVRVALEAGPIAPELQRRYSRAEEGELWQVEQDGKTMLVLLDQPRANPAGPAFRFVYERALSGADTTFHADPQAMMALLPALESWFSAWPSFAGMALHELPQR